VRLALLPQYRLPVLVKRLVEAVFETSRQEGFASVRFFLSGGGSWATDILTGYDISLLRVYFSMLMPATVETPDVPVPEEVRIRPLAEGEDEMVLAALNRAWATTWNFRPIPMSALQRDLKGQRNGFLVAVPLSDQTHIIGTCHAILDPSNHNYDGGLYALISNLTNDPDWRGRGLGRALLTAGIRNLRERGATSVTLGVDGGNPVPVALYRSMGFEIISQLEVWTGKVPVLN
jgi:ribosomal protein S18 acetylase RimI-like enzyme